MKVKWREMKNGVFELQLLCENEEEHKRLHRGKVHVMTAYHIHNNEEPPFGGVGIIHEPI